MYGNVSYWDSRYARENYPFDWYQRYSTLRPLIRDHVSRSHKIVIIGCGRSRLTEELHADGYCDLVSVDVSPVCIQACKQQYGDKFVFEAVDVAEMRGKFPSQAFDAIIDKGCLDCLLCGNDSTDRALAALANISDLLKADGGIYMCISYATPTFRSPYLSRREFNWDVTVKCLPKQESGATSLVAGGDGTGDKDHVHYVYICRKTAAGQQ